MLNFEIKYFINPKNTNLNYTMLIIYFLQYLIQFIDLAKIDIIFG